MNTATANLLAKYFDAAFNAPEGIKKLRELILTLAMQGKLVEQDPSDPPASELLKAIEAEKQQLIKDKKIKKPKPLPAIKPEEQPYQLPKGWEWVRLGNVLHFEYGNNLPKNKRSNSGEFPVYGSNGIVGTHKEAFVQDRCIVIGRKGSAGALNLCLSYGCCVTDVAYYCVPPSCIDLNFSFKLLCNLKLETLGKGIKPGLNRNDAYNLLIAIPPFSEQLRIVARIDQLMALCDKLEKLRAERVEKRQAVHAAAIQQLLEAPNSSAWNFIQQHFGELYSVKENITELRKAILQLAMQGKLVAQDPSDPPASELLKAIEAEKQQLIEDKKIKKPKPLPTIKPEEQPYQLPKGWEWVRLNDVLDVRDGTHDTPKYVNTGYPLVTSKNIYAGQLSLDNIKYISKEDHKKISERSKVDKGDILFAMIGSIGNPVIVDLDIEFSIKNIALFKYFIEGTPNNRYLHYYLIYAQKKMKTMSSGAVQSFVSLSFLRNYPFPLPPLPEQKRIVARIDQLMALCDKLEQQIEAATDKQTELLNTVAARI
ncbi:restriction endonuclease subunit S [Neisseria montereyensis]|uniref:Restriction endonuclease subunit S n=1 Tax=Neisseria montereyensis TaxID=2973938 RepID=A0ABT2FCK1_9NEIS|nr:restriction endonuclease subunit S [Neisseria montereyensis]MCS4533949.1 restriction endonuclease subunit S [Neisseria montereyensis]